MSPKDHAERTKHGDHNTQPHSISDFAHHLSRENINGSGQGSRDAAAAAKYIADSGDYMRKHGFADLTITGADDKSHSLTAKDKDGHFWRIKDGAKRGEVARTDAEPQPWAKHDQANKDAGNTNGRPTKADTAAAHGKKPAEGWGDKYNAKHGFLTAEQGREKAGHEIEDAARRRGEDPATALKAAQAAAIARGEAPPTSNGKPAAGGVHDGAHNPDGSGKYSYDGGKGGAWSATAHVLREQAKQKGMEDYNPSNNDIANAQRRIAAQNGFHGKHAVEHWAKSLKAGGQFEVPAADLSGAGFLKAVKGSAGENPEINKDKAKAEPMKGGDSRLISDGKLKTNDLDNALHSVADAFGAGYDPRASYKSYVETEKGSGAVKRATTAYSKPQTMGELYNPDGTRHSSVENVDAVEATRGPNGRRNFTLYQQPGHHTYGHIGSDGKMIVDKMD